MLVLTQLLARWNALSRVTRVVAGTTAVAAIVLLGAVTILTHPPRVPLFAAPLHPEQLIEVEERLASWNVTFTPTADNVIVDAGRRNDLLLRLSLADVPHPHLSSTGEALASIGALTPQTVIEAQTRAGLAGDIEAGLRGIEGVDDARVIVAPAKAPEFADETVHDASASVRLRLRSGAHLRERPSMVFEDSWPRACPNYNPLTLRFWTTAASPSGKLARLMAMPASSKPRCNPPSIRRLATALQSCGCVRNMPPNVYPKRTCAGRRSVRRR